MFSFYKFYFSALASVSNSIPFYPTNFLWNSKVPSKVRAFAWLVAHKKVNTNDMLQLRRPFKALSPGGAFFVGVERQLIISSYIVRLLWDCGIEFFHRLRWNGFNLAVFAICW